MKSRRAGPQLGLTVIVAAGLLWCTGATASADRPNFVFLLVDDLGWADTGVYGSTFYETPNIDALAASGMRFTQAYAASPVCSPTRASIMTGRHPVRVNITDWLPGKAADSVPDRRFEHVDDAEHLALDEVTFAEVFAEAGYDTFFAGKWHLGGEGHLPTDQGFDINIGGHHRGSPPGGYYAPWTNPYLQARHAGEYLTERLTEETVGFLEGRETGAPFLVFLSYYNVHTPIQAYEKRVGHFREKAEGLDADAPEPRREREARSRMRQDNPAYASMVAAVDDSVGAVLGALERLDMGKNTVVFFFSDNGGLCTSRKAGPTCNLPLRSGKGWLYEGGIREPLIIRAPGITPPGSVSDAPVISMDFFPTLLDLGGLPARPDLHVDGRSFLPLLKGGRRPEPRTLFWHYPHYHGSTWAPGAAVREGPWKLIEFYEYDQVELYNLDEDTGEKHDLSRREPELTARLRSDLRAWQTNRNAIMPQPRAPERGSEPRSSSATRGSRPAEAQP